jgi:hypothetical protein
MKLTATEALEISQAATKKLEKNLIPVILEDIHSNIKRGAEAGKVQTRFNVQKFTQATITLLIKKLGQNGYRVVHEDYSLTIKWGPHL